MLKTIVSIIIIAFLSLLFVYQLAKPYFKLHPWTRNSILEGFDNPIPSEQQVSEQQVSEQQVSEKGVSESVEDDSTQKSTQMADLFEQVNTQMDVLRTLKLSDTYLPISLDKTAQEPYVILSNLRLLINNGVYKNELDIKDLNDKYIGNKGVQLLASDINSVNMESSPGGTEGSTSREQSSLVEEVRANETAFLKRTQTIVDAHQKLIDKILESKSKEEE
jgi:hypothetical protein